MMHYYMQLTLNQTPTLKCMLLFNITHYLNVGYNYTVTRTIGSVTQYCLCFFFMGQYQTEFWKTYLNITEFHWSAIEILNDPYSVPRQQ